jgi:flavin-binding protein dodecin
VYDAFTINSIQSPIFNLNITYNIFTNKLLEVIMPDHIYKHTELTGSSKNSIEEAIQNAVAKANESVRNMRWFQMIDLRGHIDNGNVSHWQVTIKIGFTLED